MLYSNTKLFYLIQQYYIKYCAVYKKIHLAINRYTYLEKYIFFSKYLLCYIINTCCGECANALGLIMLKSFRAFR